MTLEVLREFFLWCAVINASILMLWFGVFVFAHNWVQRIHGRWFHISGNRFDAINYVVMSLYKAGIILFNLVPYIVLHVVD